MENVGAGITRSLEGMKEKRDNLKRGNRKLIAQKYLWEGREDKRQQE